MMPYSKAVLSAVLVLCNAILAIGQPDQYRASAVVNDLHTVYSYTKSNWDGSHASTIYLYVADTSQLQSFKHVNGSATATLVTADIDWRAASVKKFTNHRLERGGGRQLIASLQLREERRIDIEVGSFRDSLWLTGLPWQSYDFDFAALGFTWRALRDKKAPFYFHIADAEQENGRVAFVNKGRVNVHFEGNDTIKGQACLRYALNGPGLENRGGHLWIDPVTFMIRQYKIALPDEPGYENGLLQLTGTQHMSPAQWEAFMQSKLSNGASGKAQ